MVDDLSKIILNFKTELDTNAEELFQMTHQLREELLALDVDSVDFSSEGKAQPKPKAVDAVIGGQLLIYIDLAASGGVLTSLIGIIKDWLTRHRANSAEIEIDGDKIKITSITSKEQKLLIDKWIKRYSCG